MEDRCCGDIEDFAEDRWCVVIEAFAGDRSYADNHFL